MQSRSILYSYLLGALIGFAIMDSMNQEVNSIILLLSGNRSAEASSQALVASRCACVMSGHLYMGFATA